MWNNHYRFTYNYRDYTWKVSDWDEAKLRYVLEYCKKNIFEYAEAPWVDNNWDWDYIALRDVITLRLMVIEGNFDDFDKFIQTIESPHDLYLALRYTIDWCRVDKNSRFCWVIDIPNDCLRSLSPLTDTLKTMEANSPQISSLIEELDLEIEEETAPSDYRYRDFSV